MGPVFGTEPKGNARPPGAQGITVCQLARILGAMFSRGSFRLTGKGRQALRGTKNPHKQPFPADSQLFFRGRQDKRKRVLERTAPGYGPADPNAVVPPSTKAGGVKAFGGGKAVRCVSLPFDSPGALEMLRSGMCLHVRPQVRAVCESLAALDTGKRFLARVRAHVALQQPRTRERLAAHLALVAQVVGQNVHGESRHRDVHLERVQRLRQRSSESCEEVSTSRF